MLTSLSPSVVPCLSDLSLIAPPRLAGQVLATNHVRLLFNSIKLNGSTFKQGQDVAGMRHAVAGEGYGLGSSPTVAFARYQGTRESGREKPVVGELHNQLAVLC